MFVGSNQPRSKRSFEGRAPIPSNDSYETVERKSYVTKPVEEKPLKLSSYWMDMYRNAFKGW